MSNTNLLHALKRKHEAILTDIKAVEKTIKTTHKHMESLPERENTMAHLEEQLAHVIAVIRMDHPDYDEAIISARGKDTYKLPMPIGQCTSDAFAAIREAKAGMTITRSPRSSFARQASMRTMSN